MEHVLCPLVAPPPPTPPSLSQENKAMSCCDRRGFLGMEEVRFSIMTSFLLWRKLAGGVCRVDGGGVGKQQVWGNPAQGSILSGY